MAAPPLLKAAMARRSRSAQRGFSFMEVVTTMALISILFVIAVPNFRSLSRPFALRQGAAQVAAEFQSIRMRAIARNTSYRFTYNSATRTYSMDRQNGAGWVVERTNQLPTGVSIGTIDGAPTINSRGMLNAQVTIPMTTTSGGSKTVTVNVLGKTTIS